MEHRPRIEGSVKTSPLGGGTGLALEPHPLEYIFHPRSVAVVGAIDNPRRSAYHFFRVLREFGFSGPVYPVDPRTPSAMGVPVYPSLQAIPGPVDHVISCVSAREVAALVENCVAKGVKSLHLFTARLAETGLSELTGLEQRLVRRAKEAGIRIIGPNCMGLYYPKGGLAFRGNLPTEPGALGFFSQSGGITAYLGYRGGLRGLRFSRIVSYGNAADLNEADWLDYLGHDPETEVIAAYIEGVREGRRFFDTLRRVAPRKPVILLKGGATSAGRRAVASHTASLAGSQATWQALCRQTGAIAVDSVDEMADVALALTLLKPPAGRRVGLIGDGGGGSVASADAAEAAGFMLPPVPESMRQSFRERAPEIWSLIGNPLDPSAIGPLTRDVLKLMAQGDLIDLAIADAGTEWVMEYEEGARFFREGVETIVAQAQELGKPLAVIMPSADTTQKWRWQAIMEAQEKFNRARLPVFPSIARAVRAMGQALDYWEGKDLDDSSARS